MKCNGYTGYVTSKLPYSPSHSRSTEPDPVRAVLLVYDPRTGPGGATHRHEEFLTAAARRLAIGVISHDREARGLSRGAEIPHVSLLLQPLDDTETRLRRDHAPSHEMVSAKLPLLCSSKGRQEARKLCAVSLAGQITDCTTQAADVQ